MPLISKHKLSPMLKELLHVYSNINYTVYCELKEKLMKNNKELFAELCVVLMYNPFDEIKDDILTNKYVQINELELSFTFYDCTQKFLFKWLDYTFKNGIQETYEVNYSIFYNRTVKDIKFIFDTMSKYTEAAGYFIHAMDIEGSLMFKDLQEMVKTDRSGYFSVVLLRELEWLNFNLR